VLDYNKRIDGKVLDCSDFYKTQRIILVILSDLKVSDIVITGHFHGNGAPDIITREMLSKDCKIKVVGDISCDIWSLPAHLDHRPLQNRFMVICLLMIKK
jgi:hypothetical protein